MKKYMIVERFKPGCFDQTYERFNAKGRMLPEGLFYLNSWVNEEKNICFQLMEARDDQMFNDWFARWNDLVDFEVYPID